MTLPATIVRSRSKSFRPATLRPIDSKGKNTHMYQKIIDQLPIMVDRYCFDSILGYGSHAIVLKATSLSTNHKYAAKIVPLKALYSDLQRKTAKNEELALTRLNHPSIVKLIETFDYFDNKVFLLSLCPKGTLKEHIRVNGVLTGAALTKAMYDLLKALEYSHSHGVAHCDIKPGNIFLTNDERVILADFGFSYVVEKDQINDAKSDEYIGTLSYRAPEIIQMTPFNPFKSDVWALGISFYVISTGDTPWDNFSSDAIKHSILRGLESLPDSIPSTVQDVIRVMTTKNPDERPSCSEVLKMPLFQGTSSSRNKKYLNLRHSLTKKPEGGHVHCFSSQTALQRIIVNERRHTPNFTPVVPNPSFC